MGGVGQDASLAQRPASSRVYYRMGPLVLLAFQAATPQEPWPRVADRQAIESAYRALRDEASSRNALGNRFSNVRLENNLGQVVADGPSAVQRLVERESGSPPFTILGYGRYRTRFLHESVLATVDVRYGDDDRYRDLWSRGRDQVWRLLRRREGTMRFANVLPSDIAAALTQGSDLALVVDPRVDRPINADLAAPTFEGTVSRLAVATGATYRMAGGVYWITPKEAVKFEELVDWIPMISDGPNEPIEARYNWMSDRIAVGQGAELRRWMGYGIDADAFIATVRAYPKRVHVYFAYVGQDVEAIVAHRDGKDHERRFRDLWRWDGREWRWLSRAPKAPREGLLFYDAKITDALVAFFAHHRQSLALDPSIRGRVTVYLDGYDFRFGLSKLLGRAGLTYRIENGNYIVAPIRDGL